MPYISVTYSFTNGSGNIIDADEVNQNFTDIVNGTSDGNSDIRVNNVTALGTLAVTGASTLTGNVTFSGNVVSNLTPNATSTYDLGTSAKRWETIFSDNINTTNLGIGTSPTYKATVYSGSPGAALSPNANGDDLIIANNASAGMSILTPTDGTSSIYFGDSADQDIGGILYEHTGNKLHLRTSNANYVTVDSTGSVGIGTTIPLKDLDVNGNQIISGNLGIGTVAGYKLGVFSGTSGAGAANPNADEIVVESSGSGGITILTPSTGTGSLYFGDTDTDIAAIQYVHTSDTMYLRVANTVKASLTSTGLGIGTATPRANLDSEGAAIITGNVGIGTTNTGNTLTVYSGDDGGGAAVASADDLVIKNSASGGITVLTPNNQVGALIFGDPDDEDQGGVQYVHTSDALYLRANSQVQFIVQSDGDCYLPNGNLGIGTEPSYALEVFNGSPGGGTVNANADELVIRNSDSAGISIITPNTSTAAIYFGDEDDGDVAALQYTHALDKMYFRTNNAVQMTLDSTGNVGIGTVSPRSQFDVDGTSVIYGALGIGTTASYPLQIYAGTGKGSTTAPIQGGRSLTIEDSESCGISVLTPNTKTGSIYFGDEDDVDIGAIQYVHPSDSLYLKTNNTVQCTLTDGTFSTTNRFKCDGNDGDTTSVVIGVGDTLVFTGGILTGVTPA